MAVGDNAASKGMDLVDPVTDVVSEGATEINRTRDYVADEIDDRVAADALKLDASKVIISTSTPAVVNGALWFKPVS